MFSKQYIQSVLQVILISIITWSCQTSTKESNLSLIPENETVERMKAGSFDYSYAVFKNQDGGELSKTDIALLNQGKLASDYYEDENGVIKEVRLRPIELKDKFIEIQRRALSNNPLSNISIVAVDCESLDDLFYEIERTDQEVRNMGGDMMEVDSKNQQLVVSILANCGWSEEHLHTIWLVLQHSSPGLMVYYYPQLKEYAMQGKIGHGTMALMEDRLLMNHGYKQIYGSQIRSGHLYDLEDPENVNERRSEIGLGSIEEYIDRWNLNFEEEKARMNGDL